jgi:8-oxo-dGTP pyrophosphatase MutT (NUDIX family)
MTALPPRRLARPLLQVGALVYRPGRMGPQILLITSRETRRWVIPKGWPHKGLSLPRSALKEAWEEAGVRGAVAHHPVGLFSYDKRSLIAPPLLVTVSVYPVRFVSQDARWPEHGLRDLDWVAPAEAARRVHEAGLAEILHRFRPTSRLMLARH